ncbi:ATP-dependent zinc metalloprotease FtsH [Candidatus Spyradosoma sp. SGI.093]|uniref:ATP-dependent zinc metalloprotease FtsH n=1 Tax=Candidatus Spyradosoma sp. SGI.093 TaxID=3420583 RepID=UPI003D01E2EA
MEDKDKKEKKNESRVDFRILAMWIAIIGVIAFLLMKTPEGESASAMQLPVRELVDYAEKGEVESVELKEDSLAGDRYYEIQGELKVGEKLKKFTSAGRLSDEEFAALRAKVPTFKEPPAKTLFSAAMMSAIPSLIFFALIAFFIFRAIKRSQANQMAFGRSRARLMDKEKSKVTFADVAGCDEAKEEVSEVVEFLRDAKKFNAIGGRIPKGVLLVGPPGTGKTLLARAVAGEADVPFFSISGSDFVELFVGVGASRVRDTFEQARKNSPCIVFIDEIDAVGRQRGSGLGGGNDEREQTLNSLLVEMDGFEPQDGIIVIAATNRPDVLDAALLRPGRFDRQVYVDLPDVKGRAAILAVHAKKFKIDEAVKLDAVAKTTTGFAGADLANLLNEAALVAVRSGKEKIDMLSIEEARDKISYGRERRRVMDQKDRAKTAYHEAGHALVQVLIDDGLMPLHKVTIVPRGGALGMAMFMPEKDVLGYERSQLENMICTAMAGRVGEKVFSGSISNGASSDIKNATSMARRMVCEWGMSDRLGPVSYGDNQQNLFLGREIARTQNVSEETLRAIDDEIRGIVSKQYARAEKLIADHADAHRKIAESLLEYETLDGVHVKEIVEFGEIRTEVGYKSFERKDAEKKAAEEKAAAEKAENEKLALREERSRKS